MTACVPFHIHIVPKINVLIVRELYNYTSVVNRTGIHRGEFAGLPVNIAE